MECDRENVLGQVEIRISADPSYLRVARAAVMSTAELAGMGKDEIDGVILAMDEAISNCIQHSYEGPCEKPIVVTVHQLVGVGNKPPVLEIIVRDYGKQVDPSTIRSRELDEIRPGGLGVHLIQTLMDEVEYSCPADGGMMVRMTKQISGRLGQVDTDQDEVNPGRMKTTSR